MLTKFLTTYVAPLLRSKSFSKKGLAWNRAKGLIVQVINFQKASYSNKEDVYFAINFGLVVPKFVASIFPEKNNISFYDISLSAVRLRDSQIRGGCYLPNTLDSWHKLTPDNFSYIGDQVVSIIDSEILYFLEEIDSLHKLLLLQNSIQGAQSKDWFFKANNFLNNYLHNQSDLKHQLLFKNIDIQAEDYSKYVERLANISTLKP